MCCKPNYFDINVCIAMSYIGLSCVSDLDCGNEYCCDDTCQNESCYGLGGWVLGVCTLHNSFLGVYKRGTQPPLLEAC